MSFHCAKRMHGRHNPRRATVSRSCLRKSYANTTRRISACRSVSFDFTMSMALSALMTAVGKKLRQQSAARSRRSKAAARSRSGVTVTSTRSFMYIGDCVEGIYRIMQSNDDKPFNLGTDELVTINKLVDTVAAIAGKPVGKYPQSVSAAGGPRAQQRQQPLAGGSRLGARRLRSGKACCPRTPGSHNNSQPGGRRLKRWRQNNRATWRAGYR